MTLMENPKDKFIADGPVFRMSACSGCLYVRPGKVDGRTRPVCDAYPNGIPFQFTHGTVHDSVQDDQVGTLTYVSIEEIWAAERAAKA